MNYRKTIKQLTGAVPNIGRGISGMAFSAVVFYLLNKRGYDATLLGYTWFLITSYFLVSLTGWGLRDYSVKEYIQNGDNQREIFSLFLSSKIPLLVLCFLIIIFLEFDSDMKILLAFFIFFRTMGGLLDPLILVNGKLTAAFISELVIYGISLLCMFFFPFLLKHVLTLLTAVEGARVISGVFILTPLHVLNLRYRPFRSFLYETRFYFLIALFSFFMSRVDSYILGFMSDGRTFPHYNILLNLVAGCQVIIAAIYNKSIKSVFKMDFEKATAALNKLQWQFILLTVSSLVGIYICIRMVYQVVLPPECYLLLAINLYCFCLTIKYLVILNHVNRLNFFLKASIISALVNLCSAAFLIPYFQTSGAMLANTVGSVVLVSAVKLFLKKIRPPDSRNAVVLNQDR
jgi:O-antigen/teichoic acid export membrane protein